MVQRVLRSAMLAAIALLAANLVFDDGLSVPAPRPEPAGLQGPLAAAPVVGPPLAPVRIDDPTEQLPIPSSLRARSDDGSDDGSDGDPPDEAQTAPSQAPDRPTDAAPRRGTSLFSHTFDSLDGWLALNPSGVTLVDDPVREGSTSARLTAHDSDASGGSVRTQLNGPVLFHEGEEAYIGWSTFFPADTPTIPAGGWFVFFEFHGKPHNGSPLPGVFGLSTRNGQDVISFGRSAQYGHDSPWQAPLTRNRWTDFVLRVKFSKDESVGFVELWVDGRPQTFADGSTRLRQSTIMADQNDGLYPIATNYRKAGMIPGPVTVYHDAVRVAGSYDAARPG